MAGRLCPNHWPDCRELGFNLSFARSPFWKLLSAPSKHLISNCFNPTWVQLQGSNVKNESRSYVVDVAHSLRELEQLVVRLLSANQSLDARIGGDQTRWQRWEAGLPEVLKIDERQLDICLMSKSTHSSRRWLSS